MGESRVVGSRLSRAAAYSAAFVLAVFLLLTLAAKASAAIPSCDLSSGSLSDDFETHYSAPGGLNPNLCPAVDTTLPGDNGSRRGSWFDNTSSYSGVPTDCIEQGTPPSPGSGSGAVEIHANAGHGGLAQDCIWMSHWRYISYPSDVYYGLMWYFPSSSYNDPAPGGHDRISEFNWHPFIYSGPLGYSLHGDTLQWIVDTGLWRKCTGCMAEFSNGGEYENPSSKQDNMGPISNWRIVPQGDLVRNQWIETIVHVHYANDDTGAIQSWWRVKGSPVWQESINQSRFPTIDWGPDSSESFTWTPDNENGVTTMDHLGIYRTSANPAPATTFWIDNWQQQPTFDAVANSMP